MQRRAWSQGRLTIAITTSISTILPSISIVCTIIIRIPLVIWILAITTLVVTATVLLRHDDVSVMISDYRVFWDEDEIKRMLSSAPMEVTLET
jgi:hypothetical protein